MSDRPDAELDLRRYAPPRAEQWVSADAEPPPGPPPPAGTPVAPATGPSVAGPSVAGPSGGWSTARVVVVVLGGLGFLLAGGCGALIWVNRDQVLDATIDFADAETVPLDGSCEVIGIDLAGRYEIELTARSAEPAAVHLRVDLVLEADGETLGDAVGILRDVEPGEERTEPVANTIRASEPFDEVACRLDGAVAVPA